MARGRRIPVDLRRQVIKKCGPNCFYCKKSGFIDQRRPALPMVLEKEPFKFWLNVYDGIFVLRHRAMHLDHIIPFSKGGRTELDNLVVACESCNENKRAKLNWQGLKEP